MLTKILIALFGNDVYNRYAGHPLHVLYAILIMAGGNRVAYEEGWMVFGITLFILGAFLFVVISFAINWDKVIEYWSTLDEFAKTLSRINNPDLWEALGFTRPEQATRVKEVVDKGGGFFQLNFHDAPVSMAVLQAVSNAVLSGVSLSETEIVKKRRIMSSNKFRAFSKWARDEKRQWIRANSKSDNRQGFAPTKKGFDMFYSLASESVKMRVKENDANNA